MSDPSRKRLGLSLGLAIAGLLMGSPLAARVQADDSRPIVAGFERFADDPKTDPVEAGLLLLGELNCTSCHQAEPGLSAHLNRKQAPILDAIGNRARPDYLKAYLAAPHATTPGTTMPDLLAGWNEAEKTDAVEALSQFLASTGGVPHARLSRKSVVQGEVLYEQVGCVVCHGSRKGKMAASTTVQPLKSLEDKYTIPSLTAFLLDPLKVRPSGRMPGLRLKPEEANAIAQALLKDLKGESSPNLEYRYYEADQSWEKLPDFATLEPKQTGQVDGFDVSVAPRQSNVGLQFEGVFRIDREGRYTFIVTSDDGSKLYVDDNLVVDNDGTHAPDEKRGTVRLGLGTHRIRVDAFNGGGGFELDVEWQGRGLGRQPLSGFVSLKKGSAAKGVAAPDTVERPAIDPALVTKGRDIFARIGCASCHTLKLDDKAIESTLEAPALAGLTAGKGCLADSPEKPAPRFDLSEGQRAALAVALKAVAALSQRKPTPAETITRTLTAWNCYACHERDGRGGVEASLNASFETTQKEMGDEGRLPPHLNGVGAKLNEAYLKTIFNEGAKDRPYMLTRMPRFGGDNGAPLVAALTAVDRVEPVPVPTFDETPRKVKSDGRFLVGGMALGCVKCHTFKGVEAEGIQAIDMTQMTRRLRHDWFHRYVINPPAFRPGTRMPTGWPEGKSLLPKVLGGDTARQVEAVWQFLSDGAAASTPYGLGREPMPLFAVNEAVIYRNFIQGSGPRAIGVGYPEKANLAFDANDCRVALIWQGGFMDASRHWVGRGEGYQPPMGDNVLSLPAGAPFASLSSLDNPWPMQPSRALGYQFRGYRLAKDQRPTFLYEFNGTHVEDRPDGVAGPGKPPASTRTLTLTSDQPADDLYLRVAVGETIKPQASGWFLVNGEWKVHIEAAAEPVVRTVAGKDELLVPIKFHDGKATVVEQFEW